jgi:hypothetical protein
VFDTAAGRIESITMSSIMNMAMSMAGQEMSQKMEQTTSTKRMGEVPVMPAAAPAATEPKPVDPPAGAPTAPAKP